jgi:hypothetical protein
MKLMGVSVQRALAALAIGLVAIAGLAPSRAGAAEITSEKLKDSERQFISIIGDIEEGDLAKFRRLAVAHDDAVVYLASDGGLTAEALEIGRIIRIKGYDTFVSNDADCNSSCALIWLAGQSKFLEKGAHVGFHATYVEQNGRKRESGVGNAVVGTYLAQLNLSQSAVVFATSAPPDRLNILTTSNAASVGIPVETIGGAGEDRAGDDRGDDPRLGKGTRVYKNLGDWLVAIDDTLGGGCFVLGSYDDVAFRFGVDARTDKLTGYLLLLGEGWNSIESRKDYPVEVTFGSAAPWKVTAQGVEMGRGKGLFIPFDRGRVFEAISKAPDLRVRYGGKEVAHLKLDGSSAALDAMVQCQFDKDKPRRDPFAR